MHLLIRSDFEQTRKSKGTLKKLLQEEDIQKWAFGTTITAMKAEIRDIETKSQDVYVKGMKTELENLRDRTLYFGSYKPENIEMATGILADDVHKVIMEHAPTLYSLLKTLSHDRRTESPQTESRITTILQILCFNRNQNMGKLPYCYIAPVLCRISLTIEDKRPGYIHGRGIGIMKQKCSNCLDY
jgi:hypothetical protein